MSSNHAVYAGLSYRESFKELFHMKSTWSLFFGIGIVEEKFISNTFFFLKNELKFHYDLTMGIIFMVGKIDGYKVYGLKT